MTVIVGYSTVYIPGHPEGSKYANDDNFVDICQYLIYLSNNLHRSYV